MFIFNPCCLLMVASFYELHQLWAYRKKIKRERENQYSLVLALCGLCLLKPISLKGLSFPHYPTLTITSAVLYLAEILTS